MHILQPPPSKRFHPDKEDGVVEVEFVKRSNREHSTDNCRAEYTVILDTLP